MSKSQLLWTTIEGAARVVAARARPPKMVEKRILFEDVDEVFANDCCCA